MIFLGNLRPRIVENDSMIGIYFSTDRNTNSRLWYLQSMVHDVEKNCSWSHLCNGLHKTMTTPTADTAYYNSYWKDNTPWYENEKFFLENVVTAKLGGNVTLLPYAKLKSGLWNECLVGSVKEEACHFCTLYRVVHLLTLEMRTWELTWEYTKQWPANRKFWW